ncbi:MAG: sugar ABC transporter permease [Treponema sp.]|nr:sugar ABC transporter permease [Treponema sp.]
MNRKTGLNVMVNLVFIGPIFILYTTFFIIPLILSFVYSATDWDGLQKTFSFIGLRNYLTAFTMDTEFRNAVRFTFVFTFWGFIGVNAIGLICAMMVNLPLRVRNLVRTCIYVPNVISVLVVGFLWRFLYRSLIPEIGKILRINFLQQSFLTQFKGMEYVILIPAVWQSVGFAMLIYLAGLQGIPSDLREVMILDGANAIRRFFHLTLPFLVPSFIAVSFTVTTGALKVFDIIMALTGGGPGKASESIAIHIYREGLGSMKYGLGSAKAIIFALIILIITVLQFIYLKSKEIEL